METHENIELHKKWHCYLWNAKHKLTEIKSWQKLIGVTVCVCVLWNAVLCIRCRMNIQNRFDGAITRFVCLYECLCVAFTLTDYTVRNNFELLESKAAAVALKCVVHEEPLWVNKNNNSMRLTSSFLFLFLWKTRHMPDTTTTHMPTMNIIQLHARKAN